MNNHIDSGSLIVALVTLLLFVAALFTKGLSHDLFLEAGVFLVSVKIIITTYKNSVAVGHLDEKLDRILAELVRNPQEADSTAGSQGREKPKE